MYNVCVDVETQEYVRSEEKRRKEEYLKLSNGSGSPNCLFHSSTYDIRAK